MSWNEPGGSGNKDPWGNRKDQGPPDLDEAFKKFQEKISGIFGGGRRGSGGKRGSGGGTMGMSFIAIVALGIWALSGIYIVDEGRQGVVLQFGKFFNIAEPGPHWYPRFIQSVQVVDVEKVRSVTLGRNSSEALMLTKDENIVDIEFTIQYKVKDVKNFLFDVNNPDITVVQATESAMREVVGKNEMDFVIKDGRLEVAARTEILVQKTLDSYKAGVLVTNLNMQDAQPPQQVQHAFDDAIKAREDKERKINEAEAYANDIIPKARGKAARMIQEARGYRDGLIAKAIGESKRFTKLLTEYEKAPRVTRKRLYLETLEKVYEDTNKVMVDVQQGNSLMYLPIDKIMQQGKRNRPESNTTDESDKTPPPITGTAPILPRSRDRFRNREVR